MKILIALGMPEPQAESPAKPKPAERLSIEDQVRDAIECVESGYRSDVEWVLLNKLYKDLRGRKQTPRIRNLLKMIQPVLSKFGYHGTSSED